MDLSIWEKESFYAPADITILGSGFVGLWTAYYLKKTNPSLLVRILDRGIIPTGASTRNAGFACFGSVTELIADLLNMGESSMLDIVEMRYKGLQKIRKTFKEKEIGYETLGGFELITPGQSMDLNILRSNIDWLNQRLRQITGKNKAFYLDDARTTELGLAGVQHLIHNRLEGQLHSGKLCAALLQKVQSMGVMVLNNTEVTRFEKVNGGVELTTNHPFTLHTGHLLICTNAFAKQLLPDMELQPARGQILVTAPIAGLKIRGTFHYDEGYYYFRNLGDRILLGGARNKAFEAEQTFELTTSPLIQQELEDFLHRVILPGQAVIVEHRWSGIMGIGPEKTPIIKTLDDNISCAVRMSGMGVALAPEIGKIMARRLTH